MARGSTLRRGGEAAPGQLFPVAPKLSERQWQHVLQGRFSEEEWAWQHVYRMQSAKGRWMTSTTATGWPDLTAWRRGYVLAIECKSGTAKWHLEPGQLDWLERFAEIPTGRAWLLDPLHTDWQDIANWIHDPESAPRRVGFYEGGVEIDRARRGATR